MHVHCGKVGGGMVQGPATEVTHQLLGTLQSYIIPANNTECPNVLLLFYIYTFR